MFKLALERNNHEPIANYLSVITTGHMGLPEKKSHDITIAKLILEIKEGIGL